MRTICTLISAILTMASLAMAETTVTTDPVGYVTGTCKANSDTIVSVPLAHAAEFVGTISGAATVVGDAATVVASGTTPSWTANQFAALYTASPSYPTYYLKFKSGTLSGKYFTITANAANAITFDTNGDNVAGAVAGDQFSVTKYWTLGELFPQGVQTTLAESKGTLLTFRMSELFIPDNTTKGYNLAPPYRYFILSKTVGTITPGWKSSATGFPDATNIPLYPDTFFIVRHPSSLPADTTFTFTGTVNTDSEVTPLTSGTLQAGQANFVTHQRPVGMKLSELGLTAANFTPSEGQLLTKRKDELLVYENSVITTNKVPSLRFYVDSSASGGNHWKKSGGGATVMDDFVLEAGTGFVIKKAPGTSDSTVFWTNTPTFSNQ